MFAATQALGWALFSSSLISVIYLISSAARGMAYCIRCWVFATGSAMLASQLVHCCAFLYPSKIVSSSKSHPSSTLKVPSTLQ
jgi:hypothetical protein